MEQFVICLGVDGDYRPGKNKKHFNIGLVLLLQLFTLLLKITDTVNFICAFTFVSVISWQELISLE